jgi:hypothetical protein
MEEFLVMVAVDDVRIPTHTSSRNAAACKHLITNSKRVRTVRIEYVIINLGVTLCLCLSSMEL